MEGYCTHLIGYNPTRFFFTLSYKKIRVGELIGVATESKDGLLQAGTFRYLGLLEDRSLDNIGSGYGYSYGAGGAGVYGIFLSFFVDCKLQFKCNYADGSLFTRTYNQEVKKWSEWKRII